MLLSALIAPAFAATLTLPPGSDLSAWSGPARLAGFTLAPPGSPAEVVCLATSAGWDIRVEGLDGRVRTASVGIPVTPEGREDVAWLASSLLASVVADGGGVHPTRAPSTPAPAPPSVSRSAAPPLAAAPATPAPPRPRSTSNPPAPPPTAALPTPSPPPPSPSPVAVAGLEVETAPGVPSPRPSAPPAPAVQPPTPAPPPPVPPAVGPAASEGSARSAPTVRPAPRSRIRLQASVGPALVMRPAIAPALAVPLAVGLLLDGRDWLFVEAAPLTSRALGALGADRSVVTVEVRAGYSWSPDLRLAPTIGAVAGVSVRSWHDGDTRVHAAPIPVLGAEGGARLRLTPGVALAATARIEGDVAPTTITVGDAAPEVLSPWQPSVGISLIARTP